MSSALRRGRTLHPGAVKLARYLRQQRMKELEAKRQANPLSLTRKERHELSRIGGTRHPVGLTKEGKM